VGVTPALRLDGIAVSFRGVRALSAVSFEVGPQDRVGLIGPNGAGKTSVFNVISGLYPADSGSVRVFGEEVTGRPPQDIARLGVARTFQNLKLFPTMTVANNVLVGRHLRRRGGVLRGLLGLDRRNDAEHADEVRTVLDLCDLGDVGDVAVATLSYGEQKRVELARALATEPRVLLLDEPGAGMNESEKSVLAAVVHRSVSTLGCALLVVEHDIGFVRSLTDRIVVLDHGSVIANGAPNDVLSQGDVQKAYLGEALT